MVSTSSTRELPSSPPVTVSGDQLWLNPRGRIVQPLACAQFASATIASVPSGVTAHSASVVIAPDQFR